MNTTQNAKNEQQIARETYSYLATKSRIGAVKHLDKATQLTWYDYHQPKMRVGKYHFTITQKVYKNKTGQLYDTFKKNLAVEVALFLETLKVNDIHQIFPPNGIQGDFSNYLPHLTINRSTLPWETSHYSQKEKIPYLALVVLNEDEIDNAVTGQAEGLQMVKIPPALLPKPEELKHLVFANQKPNQSEKATFLAHRFPSPNKNNVVHLIALHEEKKDNIYPSLYQWTFKCTTQDPHDFKTIVGQLKKGLFRLPNIKAKKDDEKKQVIKGFAKILFESVLREKLPPVNKEKLAKEEKEKEERIANYNLVIKQGYTPMPHFARNGQRIMSWYRSPLIPFDDKSLWEVHNNTISTIFSSDQLLRYFSQSKRLDVTYASAWELGKWLTLKNKEIATALYNWKKQQHIQIKIAVRDELKGKGKKRINQTHLNEIKKEIETNLGLETIANSTEIPPIIVNWLEELALLEHLPFPYLVPDKALLPDESIRFFHLDDSWIWAMLDGAMSIGRLNNQQSAAPFKVSKLRLSGCLIRSEAVAHYPDLRVAADGGLIPVEMRKIGRDVLLTIFKTDKKPIQEISLFLPPSGLQFGIDNSGKKTFHYKKEENTPPLTIDVTKDYCTDKRLLKVTALAKKMKTSTSKKNTSSVFAFRMIQGAPLVHFKVGKGS